MIKTAVNFARRYSHINWALADQTMVSGSNFVTGILLARMLGIAEFGRFTLAWMVVMFVQSIQHASINAPMMSIGPKQEAADQPAYYGAVFLQQIMFAVLSAVITFAGVKTSVVFFPNWGIEPLALPLTAAVFFSQIQDFLRRYYFITETPAQSFMGDFIRYIGQIAMLFVLLLYINLTMTISIALWVVAGFAMLGTVALIFSVKGLDWSGRLLPDTTRRNWHFSKWIIASGLTRWLTGNLFFVAAGAIMGVTIVGALKVAQNLMGLTHILFLGLENIVPMSASRHYISGGYNALSKYLFRVTFWGTIATTMVALFFAIAPDFWFNLLFGEQFVQYSYLVRWYAVLYIIMFFGLPLRFGLRTIEKTRIIFVSLLSAAFIAMISSYPLINAFGAIGAVMGMIFIQVIMQVILWRGYFDCARRA